MLLEFSQMVRNVLKDEADGHAYRVPPIPYYTQR